MADYESTESHATITRRSFLKKSASAAVVAVAAGVGGFLALQQPLAPVPEGKPIVIGLQVELTGIGATYGSWYLRVTQRCVDYINNELGGIGGRPIKLVVEDTATDAAVGARKLRKLVLEDKADFINGALFSNVVIGSLPVAEELKTIYFANSEGYHVPAGMGGRYSFQLSITDVRSQVTSIVDWVLENLGKRWSIIFPDYAFGYDHRDWFTREAEKRGAQVLEKIPVPGDAVDFLPYIGKIKPESDAVYHVIVGPGIFTFVKQLSEFGFEGPKFGFVDSIEGIDIEPLADVVEGWWFWEAFPRRLSSYDTPHNKRYREIIGVDEEGRAVEDQSNVSVYSHMFSVWESLFIIKQAVEETGWKSKADDAKVIEYLENLTELKEGLEHPQGRKIINAKNHQCFGHQNVSLVENGKLNTKTRLSIEASLYEPEVDYTTYPL